MSAKFKIFLVLTLSLFATAVVAGVYIIKRWHFSTVSTTQEQQQIRAKQISTQKIVTNPYRAKYKSIPLTRLKSVLKGTDPATLAVNAFDPNYSKQLTRKVEVSYPQPDRAMVTITQTNLASSKPKPIKYRVELTSFGRSLFVSSPQLWQIVWAGSYEQCLAGGTVPLSNSNCR
ncbi:MAG: hypothetical protein VKN72_29215 [Nostocales cyanobacterium 94392]|nr:hypothetical protein [Nostocales cyanobacterium 94392]